MTLLRVRHEVCEQRSRYKPAPQHKRCGFRWCCCERPDDIDCDGELVVGRYRTLQDDCVIPDDCPGRVAHIMVNETSPTTD